LFKKLITSRVGQASRNPEPTGDKPRKRGERSLKRTSEELQKAKKASTVSVKRARTQSGAARRHHNVADDLDSIENSVSLGSSEDEEASIHETDDDEDGNGTDDCDVAAAWDDKRRSDIECDSNKEERATYSRTAFNEALEREKENPNGQDESPPSKTPRNATQSRVASASSHHTARVGTRSSGHTAAIEVPLLTDANPARQQGGRLEALVAMDLDEIQAGLHGLTSKESMEKRQPHVADRVLHYVKSVIFQRIKFVDSDQMSQKAL
jgi:hypothetical protein